MEEQNKLYGLRYDLVFKKIFHNKTELKKLMKYIFNEKLEDFWYVDKELTKNNINLSYGICDMVIETPKRIILIEVQNKNLKNLAQRLKMYISELYVSQGPGKDYKTIKPVEAYVILNYNEGTPSILKEYELLEKNMQEQFGKLSKIKLWSLKEAIKDIGTLNYNYARLFRLDMYGLKKEREILEESKKNSILKRAAKEIEFYNMDLETYQRLKEEERMQMSFELATSMIRHDAEDNGIRIGEKRGKKEGIKIGEKRGEKRGKKKGIKIGKLEGISVGRAEGIQIGREEGKIEEKLEIAKNLLLANVDLELVMKTTGLAEEQLKNVILEENNNKKLIKVR